MLAGGASRRMGSPKALVGAGGAPMGRTVAEALLEAGADRVVVVGGEPAWAADLALEHVADRWPGIGPLGGLATALAVAARGSGGDGDRTGPAGTGAGIAVVAACDQPAMHGDAVVRLVAALEAAPPGVGAAAFVTPDGRRHPLPSAWRVGVADALASLVEGGARRADAGFDPLGVVEVPIGPEVLVDLDTPAEVRTWETGRGSQRSDHSRPAP